MSPYSIPYRALRQNYNQFGLASESLVVDGGLTLSVNNGNVQGNKKDPNPFYFRRNEQRGVRLYRRTDFLANPGSFLLQTGGALDWPLLSGFPGGMSEPYDESNFALAYSRALGKVRPGSSQVLIDLAESGSTVGMFRAQNAWNNRIFELLDIVARPMRRKLDRGQRLLDAVTSRWLEHSYGWMPLMLSVYDAAENLRNEVVRVRKVEGRAKRVWTETAYPLIQAAGSSPGPVYATHTRTVSKRALVSLQFEVNWDDSVAKWTALNPASIAWELLPLSFVADWFVGIGDLLADLENVALYRSSFVKGFVTYTSKLDEKSTISFSGSHSSERLVWQAEAYGRHRGLHRVVMDTLPTPTAPQLHFNVNAKRALDAAALFHQLWGKTIRRFL